MSCPKDYICTDLSDAATTHNNYDTTLNSKSAPKASFNNTISQKNHWILAFLRYFQEMRQEIFQNRPNCNQIGISKVSNGSCHFEQLMYFTTKKRSKSGSGIGFETVCNIFIHHIITQLNLWTKVPYQSPHCKLSPWKSRFLNIESVNRSTNKFFCPTHGLFLVH